MTAVADADDAKSLWPDADTLDPGTLSTLLDAAWEDCESFLPAELVTTPPTPTPRRWVVANVLHARDLWTAYRQEGGVVGFDSYAVRIRPLSDTVRAQLRPPRGTPKVG